MFPAVLATIGARDAGFACQDLRGSYVFVDGRRGARVKVEPSVIESILAALPRLTAMARRPASRWRPFYYAAERVHIRQHSRIAVGFKDEFGADVDPSAPHDV